MGEDRRVTCSTDTCVEVVIDGESVVQVRDTKDPGGPWLTFTAAEWEAFLDGVRAGQFDLPGR